MIIGLNFNGNNSRLYPDGSIYNIAGVQLLPPDEPSDKEYFIAMNHTELQNAEVAFKEYQEPQTEN